MNTRRISLTASAIALIAGAAAGVQQSNQPRDPAQPGQRGAQQDRQVRPAQPGMNQPGRSEAAAQGFQLIPSDWVMGADVVDSSGEKLGDVDDLVLDTAAGRVSYALISHGGVLGVGGKLVAVPWRAFQWNSDDRTFTLPMTADRLEQAPTIDKDRIEELSNPEQGRRTFGFFNVRDDRGAAADQQNGWNAKSEYQNLLRSGKQASVSGTVTSIDRDEPMRGMPEGIIVTISAGGQQGQGQERIVHLGPAWFIDRQEVMLRLNDNVQIEGIEANLDGNTVVVAKSLSSPYGTFRLRDEQNNPVWDAASGQRGGQGQNQQRPNQQVQNQGAQQQNVNQQQQQNQPQVIPTQQTVQGQQPAAQGVQPVGEDALRSGAGNLKLLSQFADQTVRTQGEDDLGDVESVVLDAMSGKLAFVVVGVGGFLGVGETNAALPWSAIRIEPDNRLMAVNVDRNTIENAPRIESDEWAELRDRNFTERVYGHFGQPNPFAGAAPGTQRPAADRPGQQPGQRQDREAQQRRDQQNDQHEGRYNQLFQSGQRTEVSGKVRTTSQAQPMGLSQPILVVLIAEQDGTVRTVHLAPGKFLEDGNFNLKQGDQITVQGRSATIEGQDVVIASQVQKEGKTLNLRGDDGTPRWGKQGN